MIGRGPMIGRSGGRSGRARVSGALPQGGGSRHLESIGSALSSCGRGPYACRSKCQTRHTPRGQRRPVRTPATFGPIRSGAARRATGSAQPGTTTSGDDDSDAADLACDWTRCPVSCCMRCGCMRRGAGTTVKTGGIDVQFLGPRFSGRTARAAFALMFAAAPVVPILRRSGVLAFACSLGGMEGLGRHGG